MPLDLLITVPLGFGLGFLIGLTGVGGGALVAPALYVILGLSYSDAIAVSLIYSVFTKIVGAVQHIRQGTVLWRVTLLYGLSGVPGAVLGSRAIYWAGIAAERTLPFVLTGILFVVALLILVESPLRHLAGRRKPFSPQELKPTGVVVVAAWQTLVGLLMGITSVGSGSLVIVSMLYLYQMTASEIVGSSIVVALIMAVPAGLTHYAVAGVSWPLLALLLLGSGLGAVLGARVTLRVSESALKQIIVVLVTAAAVSTLVKGLGRA